MTDLNGTVTEEESVVAETKVVIQLMKLSGHYTSQAPHTRCV